MEEKELIKLSPKELTDMGYCATCLDRKYNGAIFGDDSKLKIYEDEDNECLFVSNPRADGHMIISTKQHFHDMSECTDALNTKIIMFAKAFMNIIKEVYKCERVYLCTMSDGPMNHYHVQLIPRYAYEKRGSENFVKPRKEYVFDKDKFEKVKTLITQYAKNLKS